MKPGWGIGQVLEDSSAEEVRIFFEFGGRRTLNPMTSPLLAVETAGKKHPILDILFEDLNWKKAHHHVYVVLLDRQVLGHKRFVSANPFHTPGKPSLYVGMSGLSPEKRFQNHKAGYKANTYVQRYGRRLVPALFREYNPMPFRLAEIVEFELAKRLRRLGYAVWQH